MSRCLICLSAPSFPHLANQSAPPPPALIAKLPRPAPFNPLRPRRCAVRAPLRTGLYFSVSAFASVRLTHGARGVAQYWLPLFEGAGCAGVRGI
jgi:hypothetical protein